MRKRIQVGNLNDSVDDRSLSALFAPYGVVRRATVANHRDTGRCTGVGFVEMGSVEEGDAAVAALGGHEYGGRVLSVCWSMPRSGRSEIGPGKPVPELGAVPSTDRARLDAMASPDAPDVGGFGDRGGADRTGD